MTDRAGALHIHAVAIQLGCRGVLIEGPAGAGKTTLGFELVERMRGAGRHGAFIADDRCLIHSSGGRLIARAPDALAGLAELHGLGIARIPHADAGVIDLVVRLVPGEDAERMPEPQVRALCDVSLPCLPVGVRQARRNARLIFAHPALALDAP